MVKKNTSTDIVAVGDEIGKKVSPVIIKAALKYNRSPEELMEGLSPDNLYWSFALNFQRVMSMDANIIEKAEKDFMNLNMMEREYLIKVRGFYTSDQWVKMKTVLDAKKHKPEGAGDQPPSVNLAALVLHMNRGDGKKEIVGQLVEAQDSSEG